MDKNFSESTFILLSLESIKYILSKSIPNDQQKSQITELGIHLGEKIANYLMNSQFKSNVNQDFNNINTILNFLCEKVWNFIFAKKATKRQEQRAYYIDTTDIKLHSYLVTSNKNQDDTINCVLWFIEGIIKGVLISFNVNCDVGSNYAKENSKSSDLFNIQYIYSFKISLLD